MKKTNKINIQLPDFNIELLGNNTPTNKVLFYPCCGSDIIDAISYFHPLVDTFFFCDSGRNVADRNRNRKIKENLPDFNLYKSTEECIWEKNTYEIPFRSQLVNGRNRINEPHLYKRVTTKLTQIWKNEKDNKKITIIRVVGDGYEVFTNDEMLKQIGIFFYRGDGTGEGGSDVRWLETEKDIGYSCGGIGRHFDVVLQKIANKGLIVTDGSNCGKEYGFFKQYWRDPGNAASFDDSATKDGNIFKCIGKITERYGPTLVWQIEKVNEITV